MLTNPIVAVVSAVFLSVSSAAFGALCAAFYLRLRWSQAANAERTEEARRASETLSTLHELAARMAIDVGEHNTRVEEINSSLNAAPNKSQPAVIVNAVSKLIEANARMQQKLATTEDKIRAQAEEIQSYAAEARTDALTKLANRRAFDDEMARRLSEWVRHGRPFSLAMVDVDRFKQFNDTHGHQVGDEVLQGVAAELRETMRDMDLVARYGGEEFALILPGTSLGDAFKAANRAREAVARAQFQVGIKQLQVTASLGVAQVLANEHAEDMIRRADQALYASKQAGRNCVHLHDGWKILGSMAAPGVPPLKEPEKLPEPRKAPPPPAPEAPRTEPNAGTSRLAVDLPNRTTFCQEIRNQLAGWKRGGPAFSVVLFDLHAESLRGPNGDVTLTDLVSDTMATAGAAPGCDWILLASYGPNRYGVLLPSTTLVDALQAAERLRKGIGQSGLDASGSSSKVMLRTSVVMVQKTDDLLSLLARAEAGLDPAGAALDGLATPAASPVVAN